MLLPLFEKESTRAGTDHYLSALSARVAGGQQVVGDKQPIVSARREIMHQLSTAYTHTGSG